MSPTLPRRLVALGSVVLGLGGLLFGLSSLSPKATAHTTALMSDPVTVLTESWGASGAEIGPLLVDMDNLSGWVPLSSLSSSGHDVFYCFTVINLGTTDLEFSGAFSTSFSVVPGQTWSASQIWNTPSTLSFRAPSGTSAKFLYKIDVTLAP